MSNNKISVSTHRRLKSFKVVETSSLVQDSAMDQMNEIEFATMSLAGQRTMKENLSNEVSVEGDTVPQQSHMMRPLLSPPNKLSSPSTKGFGRSTSIYDAEFFENWKEASSQMYELNMFVKESRKKRKQTKETPYKSFDLDYVNYLEQMSDFDQTTVLNEPAQLLKPKVLEKQKREKFINDLKNDRKVDSYTICTQPILPLLLENDDNNKPEAHLHPETLQIIKDANKVDLKLDNEELNATLEQEAEDQSFEFAIVSVDIDHYSFNEKSQFMIVKVIEEAISSTKHFMFQTIRIYRECLQQIKQNVKKSSGFFGKEEVVKRNYRYKLVKSFIVQDSGPMSVEALGQSNIQCPSIIYNGSCLYFFIKNFEGEGCTYVLNRIELNSKQLLQISMEKLEDYTMKVDHQKSIGVYFAQDGKTKGRKLKYTDNELAQASENEENFLKNQFIQVVAQDLETIKIFSFQDLNTELSLNLKTSEQQNYIKNDKYIGTFVLRGEVDQSFQIERILNFQKEADPNKIDYFVSLYNNCYFISKLIHDQNEEKKFSEELLCFNYMKRSAKKKSGPDLAKNMELCQVNLKVKCLQQIYLFKYCKPEQEEQQTYFDQIMDPSKIVDVKNDDMGEPEEEENDIVRTNNQANQKKFTDYVKVHYFIDEQGFIQLVNLHDLISDSEKQDMNPQQLEDQYSKRNEFYRRQLRFKIGHPFYLNKTETQVRVTYVYDQLTYEDTKFPAAGIIEHFVHASNNYPSREIQNKNANYIVAQNGSAQYLYVFKQQNKIIDGGNRPDFSFDIVKLINFKLSGNTSLQRKQIIKFFNKPVAEKMSYVPQVRLNNSFKGVLSNWQGVSCISRPNDDLSHLQNDPSKCNMYEGTPIESLMQFMIVESDTGEYLKLKIYDRILLKRLEEKHLALKKGIQINFSFLPMTYAKYNNIYVFFFELRAYYKTNQEYQFVAENFLVKYTIEDIIKMSQNKDDSLIRVDTKVQYLVEPEKHQFSLGLQRNQQNQQEIKFVFSDEIPLQDYNIYLTKFFSPPLDSEQKNDPKELVQDFSKYFFDPSQSSIVMIFEQIVDSKISQNFIPFILFYRKISKLNGDPQPIDQIMFQNLYFKQDKVPMGQIIPINESGFDVRMAKIYLSSSEIVSPQLANRCTLATDNSINLWRTSDIFVNSEGNYVVHYDVSFNYTQDIERVQIWDMQVNLSTKADKQVVKKIGLTEVLVSSLKTVQHSDQILAMQHRINEIQTESLMKSELDPVDRSHNKYMDLLKSDDNPSIQEEKVAFKAVRYPEIDEHGYIKQSKMKDQGARDNGLIPVSNFYRSPFCEFGYVKYNNGNDRSFDFTFRSRLSNDCILKNIFTDWEILNLHKDTIRMMMQMKPVLFCDFDFLLMHTYQTFNIDIQMQESFFKPQELFRGQTMCDINLNDPETIIYQIQKYIKQKDDDEEDDEKQEVVMQLEGSLFDMLTQNNPFAKYIKKTSHLRITDYLIVSLDFTFKSQMMRCKDIRAKNSFKILVESIHEINKMKYGKILEHDLFSLMNDNNISEIVPFFERTLEDPDPNNNLNVEWLLKGDLVPTTWYENDSKLKFYKFNDANHCKEEIAQHLQDIANGYTTEQKKYEVQYNAINFQRIQFGEKIKRIFEYVEDSDNLFDPRLQNLGGESKSQEQRSIEDFKFQFDDLCLAQLMIQENDNKQLYDLKTAQQIVDAQFDVSSAFFKWQMTLYILGYCIPLMICFSLYSSNDYHTAQKVCLWIATISLCFQFVFELGQAYVQGTKWINFYNLVDFCQFISFGFYVYQTSQGYLNDKVTHPDEEEFYMVILKTAILFLTLNKICYFLRIFDEFGFLVRMIGLTFSDMIPFSIFFMINVIFFMALREVLKVKFDDKAYPDLNGITASTIITFRNSIGDLAEPDYTFWVERDSTHHLSFMNQAARNKIKLLPHWQCAIMIYSIWMLWLFQVILMVIILLNFLIAVISQTYERVVSQQVRFCYSNKAEMNLEYYQIMSYFPMGNIKYMVFVSNNDMTGEDDENEWLGLIDQLKKFFNKKDKKVNEQLSETQEQIDRMERNISDLNKKTDDILSVVKDLKKALKK